MFNPTSNWNLGFGILYDNGFDLQSAPIINWTIPSGLQSDDLQYRVIKITEQNLSPNDVDSIAKIESLGPPIDDSGWITGSTYDSQGLIQDDGTNRWIIILAKPFGEPDSSQFIFARFFTMPQ